MSEILLSRRWPWSTLDFISRMQIVHFYLTSHPLYLTCFNIPRLQWFIPLGTTKNLSSSKLFAHLSILSLKVVLVIHRLKLVFIQKWSFNPQNPDSLCQLMRFIRLLRIFCWLNRDPPFHIGWPYNITTWVKRFIPGQQPKIPTSIYQLILNIPSDQNIVTPAILGFWF